MDDEVSVLTVSQELFPCVPETEIIDFKPIEEPQGPFVSFIPKFFMKAGVAENQQAEIPTLAEFVPAQATDSDRRAAFTSVEKRNTRFNADSDGVLFQVSALGGKSQRAVPTSLRPRFFHVFHYSFLTGQSGKR